MHFSKMHGIGNDYIYVDGRYDRPSDPKKAARELSDRHFGIGADGLIIINPSDAADFEMEMYNADGSRGKMCGNGIRCVGKYVYDNGLTTKKKLRIETLAGIKEIELFTGDDGLVSSVRADMGEPLLRTELIPVNLEARSDAGVCDQSCKEEPYPGLKTDGIIDVPHIFGGREYRISCISMGNPHCVIFMDEDVAILDLETIGPVFENDSIFPDRVNTEFVNVLTRNHIRMRVWERGSGETWACGTGACASAVASVLTGKTVNNVTVSLRGGDLEIEYDEASGHVYMTGPATLVYEGDINV